jgi:predicted permease
MRITRRDEARQFLYVLLAVCVLLLLAACFNVANFLVGRAASRRGEIALRASLGASRPRLFRQLLTEATLLGAVGVLLGAIVAVVTAQLLSGLPRVYLNLPITARLSTAGAIDFRMVGMTAALGGACVLLFGLLPSFMATMRDPIADLKQGAATWSWSRLRVTTRHVLLVLQIGLGVALAVTAGLYAQSFLRATNVTMGYEQPESVLVARVIGVGPSPDDERAFYRSLLLRMNEAPGVSAASIGCCFPFNVGNVPISLPGAEQDQLLVRASINSPGFPESYGIQLIAGRDFTLDGDDLGSSLIINRLLADRFWPNGDALGKIVLWGGRQPRTVVGIATDEYCAGPLVGRAPCVWLPSGLTGNTAVVRVRTLVQPLEFLPALRQLARQIDPKVAVSEAYVFADYTREATARQRIASVICSALAILGICLVAFGCASLYASLVRDSAREIAIRMALGADGTRLFRRIVAHGLYLGAIGSVLGLIGGWMVARQIADQLFETSTTDPFVFVAAPALVALTVLLSLAAPASTAVRRNPVVHLRGD